MKRPVLMFSVGLLCTIFPILLNASVCASLLKSIHHDINQYGSGNSITSKHLAWMNIYWLKKRLGSGSVSKDLDTTTDDPDKHLLQYTWHCPENEDTRLIAIANRKGLITFIEGQYSSEEGAELFSIVLPNNRIAPPPVTPTETLPPAPKQPELKPEPKPEQPKPAPKLEEPKLEPKPAPKAAEQPETNGLAELLNPYNEHFHSTMRSKEELVNDMVNKMKHFYKNLQDCTPGIYRYSIYLQSGFIFPVSTIQGESKGLCRVETLFTVPNLGEINAKCLYPRKDLSVYTEDEAESLVKGKTFDKNNPSPRDRIEAGACDTYVNGKLQPKLVK